MSEHTASATNPDVYLVKVQAHSINVSAKYSGALMAFLFQILSADGERVIASAQLGPVRLVELLTTLIQSLSLQWIGTAIGANMRVVAQECASDGPAQRLRGQNQIALAELPQHARSSTGAAIPPTQHRPIVLELNDEHKRAMGHLTMSVLVFPPGSQPKIKQIHTAGGGASPALGHTYGAGAGAGSPGLPDPWAGTGYPVPKDKLKVDTDMVVWQGSAEIRWIRRASISWQRRFCRVTSVRILEMFTSDPDLAGSRLIQSLPLAGMRAEMYRVGKAQADRAFIMAFAGHGRLRIRLADTPTRNACVRATTAVADGRLGPSGNILPIPPDHPVARQLAVLESACERTGGPSDARQAGASSTDGAGVFRSGSLEPRAGTPTIQPLHRRWLAGRRWSRPRMQSTEGSASPARSDTAQQRIVSGPVCGARTVTPMPFAGTGGTINWAPGSFDFDFRIGRGAFGFVYRAVWPAIKHEFAIKIQKVHSKSEMQAIQNEYDVLRSLNHPAITTYYGTCTVGPEVWIIMEFCRLGAVSGLLDEGPPLLEDEIAYVLHGTCHALVYIHAKHIVHRDIKAGNLLIHDSGKVCLADFGLALFLDRPADATTADTLAGPALSSAPALSSMPAMSKPHSHALACASSVTSIPVSAEAPTAMPTSKDTCGAPTQPQRAPASAFKLGGEGKGAAEGLSGTPHFLAPETFRHEGYSPATDIWALGITAIQLATGTIPFSHISPMPLFVRMQRDGPPVLEPMSPSGQRWSDDFLSFVSSCLTISPGDRPTAADLVKHPFLAGVQDTQPKSFMRRLKALRKKASESEARRRKEYKADPERGE